MFFENVGEKIKKYAKVSFIIEVVSAIITGLSMLFDEDMFEIGIYVMILGPFAALVVSWFIYAFGELVEKTSQNEQNSRKILEILKENKPERTNNELSKTEKTATSVLVENGMMICSECNFEQPSDRVVCWHCGAKFVKTEKPEHKWLCDSCGKMRSQSPCEFCGKE